MGGKTVEAYFEQFFVLQVRIVQLLVFPQSLFQLLVRNSKVVDHTSKVFNTFTVHVAGTGTIWHGRMLLVHVVHVTVRRCFRRRRVAEEEGRFILIVSHTFSSTLSEALTVDEGRLALAGRVVGLFEPLAGVAALARAGLVGEQLGRHARGRIGLVAGEGGRRLSSRRLLGLAS